MANKMSYDELKEAYYRQKETIKLLCNLAKDLLTVVERQNIKLDDLRSIISRLKVHFNIR